MVTNGCGDNDDLDSCDGFKLTQRARTWKLFSCKQQTAVSAFPPLSWRRGRWFYLRFFANAAVAAAAATDAFPCFWIHCLANAADAAAAAAAAAAGAAAAAPVMVSATGASCARLRLRCACERRRRRRCH